MIAPNLIKEAFTKYRLDNSFELKNGKAVYSDTATGDFLIVKGGYVSYLNGESRIKETSPIVLEKTKGIDYVGGTITPLYPYFEMGSVLESINATTKKVTLADSKQFPLIMLDTLDRKEIDLDEPYKEYDFRLYLVDYRGLNVSAEQSYSTNYEEILNPMAEAIIEILEAIGILKNIDKTYRERWGDVKKYGRAESNTFINEIVDCIEITGNLTYNFKKECNGTKL